MNSKHVKTIVFLLLAIVACTISIISFMNVSKPSSIAKATNEQTTIFKVTETNMLKKMTSDDLQRIKKQGSFTWEDFSIYESEDIGSGLFVLRYEIVDDGYLLISGPTLEQEPKKIIHHHADGEEELIYHITY